jgi:hypothetical protein
VVADPATFTPEPLDVELSHRARLLVGEILRAHDDRRVTVGAFAAHRAEWQERLDALPEPERTKAGKLIVEHALAGDAGPVLRLLGWEA